MDAGHFARTGNQQSAALRQMYYAALLLGIVLYSVLLCFWPSAPACCTAECVIALRATRGAPELPSLSDDELALICGLDSLAHSHVVVEQTETGLRLRIKCSSSSPRAAVRDLENASAKFTQRAPAYVASRAASARDRDERAREQRCWLALQQRLEYLLDCANAISADSITWQPPQGADAMYVSADSGPASTPLNPAWIEVNDQIELQRKKLDELLQTRTNEHPEVQSARTALEQLVRTLDRLPHLAAPLPVNTEGPLPEMEISHQHADHQVHSGMSDALAAIRTSLAELGTARQQLHTALDDYSEAREEVRHSLDSQPLPLWFAEVAQPAHLLNRQHGKGPARRPELLLLSFSLALGLVWWARPRQSEILQSIGQLRNEWGAEVVAVLGDVKPVSSTPHPDWTPGLLQIAQWSLLSLLAILLVLALGDSTLLPNFLHDPAMAVREAWSNWMVR